LAAPFGRTLWPHPHIILSLALTISGLSDTTLLLCSVEKEEEAEEKEEKKDDALRCLDALHCQFLDIIARYLFVCSEERVVCLFCSEERVV